VRLDAPSFAPNGLGGGTVLLGGTGFPVAAAPAVVAIRSTAFESDPPVFGDGLRCVGTSGLVRVRTGLALNGSVGLAFMHGAGAGDFYYQLWFRSTPSTFCDPNAAFNLSNGLKLAW
jgi:hypothetical protein